MITGDTVVPEPAEQFDDLEQQHRANVMGMWVFLATELLLFGGLFAAFLVFRTVYAVPFLEATHHLDLRLGTANTVVLLTSGLTMALAERMAWAHRRRAAVIMIALTIVLGVLFLGIKAFEWHHEYTLGLMPVLGLEFTYPGENPEIAQLFFNFYYSMTGLHAAHMLIGLGLLCAIVVPVVRSPDPGRVGRVVQISGMYWAFIDVVWIFVFTLLYLLR